MEPKKVVFECSFCGIASNDPKCKALINDSRNERLGICDSCITLCVDILKEKGLYPQDDEQV